MAKDAYHDIVKRALIKDGWKITHDPFVIKYKDLTVIADLSAEKTFVSDKTGKKIVIEIKVFGTKSKVSEFEKAKGQYDIYQIALRKNQISDTLFMAISDDIYASFFSREAIKEIVEEEKINLVIFNPAAEEIVKWINWEDTEKS
jgi:glycerophosphoryl diester phosphodiesterase